MADWSGLYVRQDLGASAAVAALAYSFFTAGMTVGRLVGDAINARIGPVALLRGGALLTGIPLAALLLVGQPATALFGLFLVGLGVANGVPLMFSAAGRQPDTPPGPGIAAVSSMGSLGFLAGPPVFGFIADATSLPWSLSLLILGAVVVFLLAYRAAGEREPVARRPTPTPPGAMTQFAAVLSDLDGVLVDSMAATTRAWAAWGARHGLDGVAIQAANHGKPAGEVVAQFVPPERLAEEAAVLERLEVEDTEGVVALPGAAGVLALPVVAIATSCVAPLARARIGAAGLEAPDVLVTSDQVGARQAGARLLPAGRRAARAGPRGLPRARGRARGRRGRPRGRGDRVGGHHDARAGRPGRRPPRRRGGLPEVLAWLTAGVSRAA